MEVEYDDSDDSVCVRHEDGRLIYVMPSGRVVVGNVTTENSNRPFVGYEFEELYNREFHFPEMIIAYVEGTESGEHVAVVKLDNDDGACIYSNSGMILSHRNTSLTLATTVDQLFTYKDELVSKKKERLVLTLQERKDKWMRSCFSDDITDSPEERNRRFIEEALELVQSLDMSRHEAHFMVDYVFDRDKGQPFQEVGGTILCLAALCNVHKIDMLEAGETELSRVWTKIETIRGKQKKKPNFSDDVNIISSRLTEDNKYFFFSNPALSVRTVSSSDFHTRYQTPISLLNLTNAVREIIAE
jgi:NTP pyrophosphatase (non-canonical NTP hydrolase)